ILSLRPKRVLEIGCGTGLLLFTVAPHCEHYLGSDFSQTALDYVQRQLLTPGMSHVALRRALADDFSHVEPGTFDTVIINSVIQYFPTVDYLAQVVEGAARALRPGGHIFIGDVRSFPLLEAFHAAVQTYQADDTLPAAKLQQRIRKRLFEEEELVVDPAFFFALTQHLPDISGVEVRHKRGHYHNELTQFRYDVIIHVKGDADVSSAAALPELNWQQERLTLDDLRQQLLDRRLSSSRLTCVPNARLCEAFQINRILSGDERPATVAQLREAIGQFARHAQAVDPEELCELAAAAGYDINIEWSMTGAEECFDAVLRRKGEASESSSSDSQTAAVTHPRVFQSKSWSAYANTPLQSKLVHNLVPRLRDHLKELLPEYMIPAAFMLLDELPLNSNGKINRKALPAPDSSRPELSDEFIAARSPIEEMLAQIWAEVLRLERVGVHDNFFELGGHSLLATQVVSRVREVLCVEMPLRTLFESPTVAALAACVETQAGEGLALRPLVRVGRGERGLPPSFAQQRMWLINQFDTGSAAYHIPALVRLRGRLDEGALERSLSEIVRRHESLRTTFSVVEAEPVQIIAAATNVPLPVTDISLLAVEEREEEARRLLSEEARLPFDLEGGPLLRASLLRVAEDEHILMLVMHHIVSDGWSMGVLVRELTALYEAYL
ncbi:MAG: condensation domain-containing protein, partial [Pyrinomonadaceae bacterium]